MARDWATVRAEHERVIAAMADQAGTLDAIAETLVACLRAGGRVYIFGNGGSAADAQHIAGELLGRFKAERQALPALALSTDSSTLTAIANDYGYEHVFARQLEGLVQPGDVAWAFSTSGNSRNILAAVEVAVRRGAAVIGFTGEGGGQIARACAHVFRAPHSSSDRIQEAHQLAYHYVCERVEAALLSE
jgi:D-sedoheptulose 7-phosphate isomerase